MKTYNQFISECYRIQENVQGGMVKFGYKPGRGVSVGANLQGGTQNTQWDAGVDYERLAAGTVSTPATVERGVTQALNNPGQTADTSDKVGPRNRVGVTANVAGVVNPQAPKPKPKPEEPKPEPDTTNKTTEPKFTAKNYSHADPVVDAKLRRDPKLMNRAVTLANRNPDGNWARSGAADGVATDPDQFRMTSDARKMAGTNAVAGLGFKYGDASHKNDVQAHNAAWKAFTGGR